MKKQIEANVGETVNGHDSLTGLHLFMVATIDDYHYLSYLKHGENESQNK